MATQKPKLNAPPPDPPPPSSKHHAATSLTRKRTRREAAAPARADRDGTGRARPTRNKGESSDSRQTSDNPAATRCRRPRDAHLGADDVLHAITAAAVGGVVGHLVRRCFRVRGFGGLSPGCSQVSSAGARLFIILVFFFFSLLQREASRDVGLFSS